MRRHLALVAVAVLLGACSGDDDDVAPTTAAPTPTSVTPTTGAAPTSAAVPPALFPSVENFAGQWVQANAAMGELNPDVRPLPLAATDLPVIDGPAGDMFAVAPSDDTFLAGQVDPATGAVTSLLAGVRPVSDLGPSTVRTMLGVTADVANIDDVVEAYSVLANNPELDVQSYVVSGRNDFSFFVIDPGEVEGDEYVIVVAAPATDEQTALAAAHDLADAALGELTD